MIENNASVDISSLNEKIERESAFVDILTAEINKVIVGQKEMVERLLIGLLGQGHILLEGVPGLAKTLAINTLSQAVHGSFSRIQFTPDLLPADVVGTMIYNMKVNDFSIKKGPIFANFVLADEINRAPAKVQSALLEAMQEHRVTVAGKSYDLPNPFFVLATQNPIEQEGTYPLPEAQLDRFMFNLWLDYPSFEDELEIVKRTTSPTQTNVYASLKADDIINAQSLIKEVSVPDSVTRYVVSLVGKTRTKSDLSTKEVNKYVSWGAGPRASQNLIIGGKALALSEGRFFVTEDDIKRLAVPVLRHRIVINYTAEAEGISTVEIINGLL